MRAYEYILTKQIQWAKNNRIPLIGSRGDRGRPAYLDSNLFEPLLPEIQECFLRGVATKFLALLLAS